MNKHKIQKKQRGYIALMATIVISLVLLVIVVEEGTSGWDARFNILGTEAKEQANALAEGCAEQAMAIILTDPAYGLTTITTATPNGSCTILPIEFNSLNGIPTPGYATIKTQAEVRNSYANLELAMAANDIHLGSIPTAPSTGTLFITTHVVNDDGSGTKSASDFTINISATPSSSIAGSESGTAVIVQPGSYSIAQTPIANYSTTNTGNCFGSISAGEVKFCTFTNDDITTTLTLIANVVNNNGKTNSPTDFPLFVDGSPVILGQRNIVTAGAHTASTTRLTGYAMSPWGYNCTDDALDSTPGNITMALGDNETCIINFDDLPPPAPSCADTVMILDRTGSMSSTDRANEKNAANSLVDLYAGVLPPTPLPQLGVGSIGGLDGSAASVPLLGQLSTIYTNLKSSITSMMNTTSSVGSDLAAGINTASAELNSARHIAGKERVLILVSDGDPNEPSGTTAYNTGYSSPSANTQNASGDQWLTPTNAYSGSDSSADSSDNVSGGNRHRFYNFNFGTGSGLPTGSTVTGVEIQADSWATAGFTITPGNSLKSPTATSAPSQFLSPNSAFVSDNIYATDNTNGHVQGYSNFGFSIPVNATITGIQVSTESKISSAVPVTTATLFPNGQGNYTAWTNGESTVDEIGTVDCSSADSIIGSSSNNRESVLLDLSSIPNGSTITDVTVTTYDRGDTSSGGTYKTFVRLNSTDTDAGSNLTATGTGSCTQKNQTITVPSTVKSAGTVMEVGVVKVSGNSNAVRVGAIRATITYTPANSGSIDISLSSNNGSSYTATKNTVVTTSESITSPTGNSSSDMWSRTWAPADFNNGNFVLKVLNNSTSGTTLSLDQITVNVFYTVTVPSGTSCQLGVDLSWNGGTSWSTEKIQNITGTETSYVLGGSSDDWSSAHTWIPTEFSNSNFRVRVHAIDPGASCDNAAIDHLDWLQAKIHYTQNVDPIQAALNAADSAKLSGIDIFTIHFGSDPGPYQGKKLLANLANGSTGVTYNSVTHQNGSFADPGGVTTGSSGPISPTIQSATSGGDGNGFEINPTNALTDGPSGLSGAAQNIDGAGDRHIFSGYNFIVPPGATITGIQTRLDWWLDSTSGTNSMNVELSWDGGTTWTTAKSDTAESTSVSNSRTLGTSSDTWGHAWTAAELDPTKFRVRVTANSTTATRDFYLDWIPVTVSYSVNTENGDGDNFFVAPTSADMQGIFNFIGNQVCPASLNLSASPAPTTATLNIITQVTNNNGLSKIESDFTTNISAVNPSTSSALGNATGINVTVDPGAYSVSENGVAGYIEQIGASCSSSGSLGNIVAGETRVCILNNDDIPPPLPAPNLNLNTNSWSEVPTAN